jgi:hypothetical protein
VVSRFQSALETTTAMHQLPTSITTLAMCVRPLLLSGWHTQEESTQQVRVAGLAGVLCAARAVHCCCPLSAICHSHTHQYHCRLSAWLYLACR